MTAAASDRTVSSNSSVATATRSMATNATVLPPSLAVSAACFSASGISIDSWTSKPRPPTRTCCPLTIPFIPNPGTTSAEVASTFSNSSAATTTARAKGCVLSSSIAAANPSTDSRVRPSTSMMSRTVGRPWVSVPVLSNAMVRTAPSSSNALPPLTKTPPRAVLAMPASTAAGVDIASAHGDAPTSTVIARAADSDQPNH